MKIVCAAVNSKYIHSALASWCLKAGVDNFCSSSHDVKVLETTINAQPDDFINKLVAFKPDIIAFSCYIWNFEFIIEICRKIKSESGVVIVFGGPEVSYRSAEILNNYNFVDYVLGGEGEWSFSSLIEAFCINSDLSECESLSYRRNDEIVENPDVFHSETPPSPYCQDYFDVLNGRICYFESSRGCPFRCTFCLSGRLAGLRFFDFEAIKNDLIKLSQSETRTIKFIDRTFNADTEKANAILNFICDNYGKALKEGVCFHFEIDGAIISESTMEILERMPKSAVQLEIGIQSFNKNTLKAIARKTNYDKLCENIKRLIAFNNMHIHVDLIAGLPYEDYKSFEESFNKAYLLKPHMLQLGFLKFLHGTVMRDKADDFGSVYSEKPPYEIISNNFISQDELFQLKKCESALDRLYNSGRFLFTVNYLVDDIGFEPFELFRRFGEFTLNGSMTLSETVLCLFGCFREFCDAEILREKILCDIASIKANIQIPEKLIKYDPLYKRTKKYYTELYKSNVKIVILNSCNKVYVVKYGQKEDLSGRTEGVYYDL